MIWHHKVVMTILGQNLTYQDHQIRCSTLIFRGQTFRTKWQFMMSICILAEGDNLLSVYRTLCSQLDLLTRKVCKAIALLPSLDRGSEQIDHEPNFDWELIWNTNQLQVAWTSWPLENCIGFDIVFAWSYIFHSPDFTFL